MKGVKVTSVPGAFALEGVSYGPFQASAERPFLEVPEALANGLGLPRYQEAEQVPALSGEVMQAAADGDAVKMARLALKSAQDRIDELNGKVFKLVGEREALQGRVTELERENAALLEHVKVEDAYQVGVTADGKRVIELGSLRESSEEVVTPLPADFPMRAKLVEGGFDTVEKVKAGLVKAEGAEKSPVENVQGIGAKTAEAIAAALP